MGMVMEVLVRTLPANKLRVESTHDGEHEDQDEPQSQDRRQQEARRRADY